MRVIGIMVFLLGLSLFACGCKRGSKEGAIGGGKNGKGTFTVGKATTYVTDSLDNTGHIDYSAALNEHLSQGVTAQNNANVLIWKALGPNPVAAKMPAGYFEKLGIPAPPATGDYFVSLRRYLEGQGKGGFADAEMDNLVKLGQKPWKAEDQPNIRAWLQANEKPLAAVVEATSRKEYFNPIIPERTERGSGGLISALLPSVQSCREFAAALAARAMLYAGHGMVEPAWQDLLACHKLGRLVGRGGTLIEGLVGIAIESIACKADVVFLASTQPDAKQIEGYIRDLRALPAPASISDKVEFGERFMALDHIMQTNQQGLAYFSQRSGGRSSDMSEDLLKGIDWNPALETVNKWFDRMTDAMRDQNRARRVQKLEQISTELHTLKASIVPDTLRNPPRGASERGRIVGDVIISLMMPAANKVQDAGDRGVQTFENTIIAFAIAKYGRDTGFYPKSLDQLAPKYLPKVPKDLFSDNNLIYQPTANGYLLYSVGRQWQG